MIAGLGLDQAHVDPGLRQPERGHEPGRSAADDDHVMVCIRAHHGRGFASLQRPFRARGSLA